MMTIEQNLIPELVYSTANVDIELKKKKRILRFR